MDPLRFVVYSDYLCPWCYNASLRLQRLEQETGGDLRLEWRSYLLRPRPGPERDLERFRAYTRSWRRPAAEPDAGRFREWQGDAGPPSHSVPPHLAAKAAATLGGDAFRRLHRRLLEAYFEESRDITERATLRALWGEVGLSPAEFERSDDPALRRATLAEHREAVESGVTGVPAVRLAGSDAVIVGAQPYALYRRWYDRTRAREKEENRWQA